MIANLNQASAMSSALMPSGGFDGLGFSFPGAGAESPFSGLGVSVSAAPLISAPAARQASEFQALIAPPTRPTNPSIAPPKAGSAANAMGDAGAAMSSPRVKLAYMASMNLQMTGPQSTNAFADRNELLSSISRGLRI